MYTITRVDDLRHKPYCASNGVVQGYGRTEEEALMLYRVQYRVWQTIAPELLDKDNNDMTQPILHVNLHTRPALPAPKIAGLLPAPKIMALPKPTPTVQVASAYHLRRGDQWTNRAYAVVGEGEVNGKPTVKLQIGSKGISMIYEVFVGSATIKPVAAGGRALAHAA